MTSNAYSIVRLSAANQSANSSLRRRRRHKYVRIEEVYMSEYKLKQKRDKTETICLNCFNYFTNSC